MRLEVDVISIARLESTAPSALTLRVADTEDAKVTARQRINRESTLMLTNANFK